MAMNNIYKLKNKIKHYDWGSTSLLPEFLGMENPERLPFAEMWMGTHNTGMSEVLSGENTTSLKDITGADIPVLFKILAVEKPLSIQAHPDKEQAQKGFLRENQSGISLDSPRRNYKDENHKPEIVCALSPFTMMCGFRKAEDIYLSFKSLLPDANIKGKTFSSLLRTLEKNSIKEFIHILFSLTELEKIFISAFLLEKEIEESESISLLQWNLMKSFASHYPQDAAILSPLFMNTFTLQPNQAVFLPPGVLHAYIDGFAVELMTASDNVLRGGLTNKYVDTIELMKIMNFTPYVPQIFTPDDSCASCYRYPAPCDEFSLYLLRANGGEADFSVTGLSICVVTEGELTVEGQAFKKGDTFFVPKDANKIIFYGNFSVFVATTG